MKKIEDKFVPYVESLKLKELGFDGECLAFSYSKSEFGYIAHKVYLIDYLDNDSIIKNSEKEYYYARPLWQDAFDWFREKHDMHSYIERFEGDVFDYTISSNIFVEEEDLGDGYFDTYNEAQLACLDKLIEIIQNK